MESKFVVPSAWGQSYNPGIKEHRAWKCPHCKDEACHPEDLATNPLGWYKFVIGFSREIPFGSVRSGLHRGDTGVVGCFIVECPHCFEKYFIHITVAEVKRAIEKCPIWPK